jgi:hypothetical protein
MFGNKKPNLKIMIHLFDHTVKPVLLYGSEIRRTFIGKKLREGKDNFISKLFSYLKQELVHLKFCKYILGVGKRSTSLAMLGELGRYPLYIEIIISMFKYLKRLYTNEDILLRNAFSESKYLYENRKNSWFSSMESLMRYLNISPNIFKLPGIDIKSLLLNKLKTLCNKI